MGRIIRIPIKIDVILKETGEMVESTTTRLQRRALNILRSNLHNFDPILHTHAVTVLYNKKTDSLTKFEVTTTQEYRYQMELAIEPDLIAHIRDTELCDPMNFKKAKR